MQQPVLQKCKTRLRVLGAIEHADRIDAHIGAAASVRGREADDADRLSHGPAAAGQRRNMVDHHKLRRHITARHQVRPEHHVVWVLRRLHHIPDRLQQPDEIRVVQIAGAVFPVNGPAQEAPSALVQEVLPRQIVHHHAVGGGGARERQIRVKAPAPDVAEGLAQAKAGLHRKARGQQIQSAAVALDRLRNQQVLRVDLSVSQKIRFQIPQQSLAKIREGRQTAPAVEGDHIRTVPGEDLGIEARQRVVLGESALPEIDELDAAIRAAGVKGCDRPRQLSELAHHGKPQPHPRLEFRGLRGGHAHRLKAVAAQGIAAVALRLDRLYAAERKAAFLPDHQRRALAAFPQMIDPVGQDQQQRAVAVSGTDRPRRVVEQRLQSQRL